MPDKPNQQGRQTTFRESDGCIVPTPAEDQSAREKPGNTGAGKSARPTRDSDRTPAVRSDGTTVLTRLDRIHQRAESQPEAVFDNLFSLLNLSLLRRAFRRCQAGRFKLKRKTSTKKLRAKLLDMKRWFWKQLETPVAEMWRTLNAKLRGHYQYYGINDNWPLLMAFRDHARRMARRHLVRRSQHSYLSWSKFNAFLKQNPLASPRRLTDLIAKSWT